MHQNLTLRKKPELPKELELFKILYNALDHIPIGPVYLGNYEFEDTRLGSDAIQFVKDNRGNFTVTQMAMQIATTYGLFVRAEAIAFYYYKGNDAKLWQVNKSEYLQRFEERNLIYRMKRKPGGTRAQDFYKPFVVWCIEHMYEYFQVAKVLGYAPGSIRRWANEWGYKEYTMVRSKQPDLTGKVDRVEKTEWKESEQGDLFQHNEATHLPEQHALKLPRSVKDNVEIVAISVEEAARQKEEQNDAYGSYIRQALAAGHKVTIVIEPTK